MATSMMQNDMMETQRKGRSNAAAGFTLIELIIVMGILILLAGTLRFFPIDFFYQRSVDDEGAKVAFALRAAHDKAVTQENGTPWGVHFVNPAVGQGYYELFGGATYAGGAVVSKTNLNESVQFGNVPAGSSTDVVFTGVTGLPSSAASIILGSMVRPSMSRTVNVLSNGLVQY